MNTTTGSAGVDPADAAAYSERIRRQTTDRKSQPQDDHIQQLPESHESCIVEWETRPRWRWETPWHEPSEHPDPIDIIERPSGLPPQPDDGICCIPMSALATALRIAAAGWPVFPCRGKRPMTEHGFQDGATDPEHIRAWWLRSPDAHIGVALPAGTLAVDVDDRDAFARSGLDLPDAPEQLTPSGGLHRLYAIEGDASQTVKQHPGVDTRVGGKGYVIAWDRQAFMSPPSALPPAPEWVRIEHGTKGESR